MHFLVHIEESLEGFTVAFAFLSRQKGEHPNPPNLCSRELPAYFSNNFSMKILRKNKKKKIPPFNAEL